MQPVVPELELVDKSLPLRLGEEEEPQRLEAVVLQHLALEAGELGIPFLELEALTCWVVEEQNQRLEPAEPQGLLVEEVEIPFLQAAVELWKFIAK